MTPDERELLCSLGDGVSQILWILNREFDHLADSEESIVIMDEIQASVKDLRESPD